MYKIIGADQKEYGPVSAEQLRQWIAQNRVYAQTQARRESETEWKPLSSFEEFADAFRSMAANPPTMRPVALPMQPLPGSREVALNMVKAPAIALIIVVSLATAYYLFSGIAGLFMGTSLFQDQMPSNVEMPAGIEKYQGLLMGAGCLIGAAFNGFALFGAIKMLRLQSHTLALLASIAAMLPCGCCCLLGLPFGIWALVVLNKPEVKSHFS